VPPAAGFAGFHAVLCCVLLTQMLKFAPLRTTDAGPVYEQLTPPWLPRVPVTELGYPETDRPVVSALPESTSNDHK
jgi:hypothetical protein